MLILLLEQFSHLAGYINPKGRSRTGSLDAPPPPQKNKNFLGFISVILYWITCITLIVINMQCLQYMFYSLIPLIKHRVFRKGLNTIPRPQEFYCSTMPINPPPPFQIKYLDLRLPPFPLFRSNTWIHPTESYLFVTLLR